MRVAVSGASGFVGSALVERLTGRGDEVVRLVRREASGPAERFWSPVEGRIDGPGLGDVDAVVNLAGVSIAGRWSAKRRRDIRDSRVDATRTIVAAVEASERCRILLSGSASGYYGSQGPAFLPETAPAGEDFLAGVCVAWEAAARTDAARVVLLRTGLVLAAHGGLLAPQLPLFRLGLGGPAGPGSQYQPWITMRDEVGAICHLLDAEVEGPVNLSAPNPVTNAEFVEALAGVLGRPARMAVPLPLLALGMTPQAVRELLLASARLRPEVLLDSGYRFEDKLIVPALTALLGRPGGRG